MKSKLHNPELFRFVNYYTTDLGATFKRIRKEQAEAAKLAAEDAKSVIPIKKARAK